MSRSSLPPLPGTVLQRRRLLGLGATLAAGALGSPWLGSLLSRGAVAAGDDYKALVCLFYYGGNDSINMLPPRDAARHAQYSAVRGDLALPRDSLLALGPDQGLHPAMAALAPVWQAGALAPVLNVGPLVRPLTKAQYRAAPANDPSVPASLFSHADQQVAWQASSGQALERTGWGGRAALSLGTLNPPISFGGNAPFTLSDLRSPWVLPGPGASFGAYGFFAGHDPSRSRRAALDALMREAQTAPLAEAYGRSMREAFEIEGRLAALIGEAPDPLNDPSGIAQAFRAMIADNYFTNDLGAQLYQVARFVHGRATVQGSRQVFFVQMGGFDNHADQIGSSALDGPHAALLQESAQAMAAFWQALNAIGMADRVTLFTQSDFGRTLAPNSTRGTDHAWGSHQLVMGGAVAGGQVHGSYPSLALGGPDDVGVDDWELQGRWIPSLSVDQYAATLLRWWGLGESQLDQVLPNLRNFGAARSVGFMRT